VNGPRRARSGGDDADRKDADPAIVPRAKCCGRDSVAGRGCVDARGHGNRVGRADWPTGSGSRGERTHLRLVPRHVAVRGLGVLGARSRVCGSPRPRGRDDVHGGRPALVAAQAIAHRGARLLVRGPDHRGRGDKWAAGVRGAHGLGLGLWRWLDRGRAVGPPGGGGPESPIRHDRRRGRSVRRSSKGLGRRERGHQPQPCRRERLLGVHSLVRHDRADLRRGGLSSTRARTTRTRSS
jgi:hypothetical protein